MRRIEKLCTYLSRADVFADVGCDHGYCTEYMLKNDLCGRAYISDISAKSLQKAETLLASYIREGRCIPVVADVLQGIGEPCDLVLIAGMGGEEIIKIISGTLPDRFVLQPMKNTDKVRSYLSGRVKFIRDETFRIGETYYDVVVGERGEEMLTPLEIKYGRDNLNTPTDDFRQWVKEKLEGAEKFLLRAKDENARRALLERRAELRGLLH